MGLMKLLGLTGGIGMGKSTAAEFLRTRGAQIVDTDELARQLVQPGQPALTEIQTEFGKKVIAPDGQLRREELAEIIFADAAARKKLETILHPRIRERWLAQTEIWRRENRALGPNPISTKSFASPVPPRRSTNDCSRAGGRRSKSSSAWPRNGRLSKKFPAPISLCGPMARWMCPRSSSNEFS